MTSDDTPRTVALCEAEPVRLPPRPPRKNTGSDLVTLVRDAANKMPGVVLARNNTGTTGRACAGCVRVMCRACAQRLARPIAYGLGKGGADLVGLMTFEARGVRVAVAIAVECKSGSGRVSAEQAAWARAAESRGMRVLVARDVPSFCVAIVALRGELARAFA